MSASQFVCKHLGIPPQPPPRAAPIEATECWLCGGPLDEHAWPLPLAMKQTSVNLPDAVAPHSDGCCCQCMALTSNETWNAYADRHPDREDFKRGKLIGWRNSSHIVSSGIHVTPSRPEWREHILNPPEPPFVAVMAISTQKQLIFRATVSHSRDLFPMRVEDDTVLIHRARFITLLACFEALYDMGLTKAAIETGRYPVQALMKLADRAGFQRLEREMKQHRTMAPDLVRIAALVARRTEE